MKSLTDSPGGYERCKMDLHLPEVFFGTTLRGLHKKFGKGGMGYGPEIHASCISLSKYAETMSGCS